MHHTPLTTTHVARRLNLSEAGTRALDHVLQPVRDSGGRRLYDPAIVERVATERAAKRDA